MIKEDEKNILTTLPKIESLERYNILLNNPVEIKRESWLNHKIPDKMGVYFLFNRQELYYIGKSARIRSRVSQHIKLPSTPPPLGEKEVRITHEYYNHVPPHEINLVSFILIEDEMFLQAVEMFYIVYYKPKYNFNPYNVSNNNVPS